MICIKDERRFVSLILIFAVLIGTLFPLPKIRAEGTDFETQIQDFPEDYKVKLREIHSSYPNWTFQADMIDATFDEIVDFEHIFPRKLVPASYSTSLRSMGKGAYDWQNKIWNKASGNWVGASREVIAHYMDPRNFLNPNDVFMFAELNYDPANQTRAGIEKIVKGTFLEKGFDDKTDYNGSYIDIIIAAAEKVNVSPYMIASTIKMEQGKNGTSALISGTYPGYEGYYNFFNIAASSPDGSEKTVIENGLKHAKKMGWNSRSKSIIGGAQKFSSSYFKHGQNTYYYKNFNVKNLDSLGHQYAQNIYDSKHSSANIRNIYINDSNSALHFLIPVYKEMYNEPASKPEENDNKNNYYFTDLSVSRFDMYRQNYDLSVNADYNITYSVPSGAKYVGESSFNLKKGANTVVLPVEAETGAINRYTLNIDAKSDCKLTVGNSGTQPEVKVKLGDTNSDGLINIIDLANIQKHLLNIIELKGDNFVGADTNRDGKISIVDLANVQKHLLRIIELK